MRSELELTFWCFALGLIVAYAIWSMMRADVLRFDLMMIAKRLDEAAQRDGLTEDKDYLIFRCLISVLADIMPYISLWRLELMAWRKGKPAFGPKEPLPGHLKQFSGHLLSVAHVPEAVAKAKIEVFLAITFYLTIQRLSFWPWLAYRYLFRRRYAIPVDLFGPLSEEIRTGLQKAAL